MDETEVQLLAAVRARLTDSMARLVYADWLDEQGESEKAEYLRLLHESERIWLRLAELRPQVPREWVLSVHPWCRVVLERVHPGRKIDAIRLIREFTGLGLAETAAVVETTGTVLRSDLSLDAARTIVKAFEEVAVLQIEPAH
ncbi:MAG: ribosomal protein L7/L12 [Bacteroidales bacterium]|nr:ribosomal protein L7/L12 [Bacteroidales bacterium]